MRQRFKEDASGTIRHRPIEGPPITSATIALFDDANGAIQASTAATVPSVATTLSGKVVQGSRELTVASATGIVTRGAYWVGTVDSEPLEQVRVREVDGVTIRLASPLRHAHKGGQDFRGAELTYALTSTHTATKATRNRALWTYTVGGTTYEATQLWDVVAQVFRLPISTLDLQRRISDAVRKATVEFFDDRDLIEAAEEDVYDALEELGVRPDLLRDMEQLRKLGVLSAKRILLDRVFQNDANYATQAVAAREEYEMELSRFKVAGAWVDKDENLSIKTSDPDTWELGTESDQRLIRYAPIG